MQVTLQQAIDHLYRLAVVEGKSTSTKRLSALADYVVGQLAEAGLADAETEVKLPGAGRSKDWDVAWQYDGKVRLAISLKSLLKNLSGTVPNRIDDLMGEASNLQLFSPEVVIGYLMVFDVQADTVRQEDGLTWSAFLERQLNALGGRRPPAWTIGTIEAVSLVRVDFANGPHLLTAETVVASAIADLADEVRRRNPGYAPG